jgi:hypothetical protein
MLRHVAPSVHPTYVELRLWFVYLFIGKFTVCCTTPTVPKYPGIALHAPLPLPAPRSPLPDARVPDWPGTHRADMAADTLYISWCMSGGLASPIQQIEPYRRFVSK